MTRRDPRAGPAPGRIGIYFVMVIVMVAFLPSWVVVVIFAVPAFTAVSVRCFSDMQTPAP